MLHLTTIQASWKRVLVVFFTAITILTSAASCTLFGTRIGGGDEIALGVIKRDPDVKADGFGFINQEKLYTGEIVPNGLAKVSGLKLVQADSNNLYLLTQAHGFFRTKDGGKNWERKYLFGFEGTATEKRAIQNEINAWLAKNNSFTPTDFAVAAGDMEIVYVAGQFQNVGRIYKSQTGGNNFKQVYTSVERNGFVRFVATDPQNDSMVYAVVGADTLIRSTNGGETWQKMHVFDTQTVVQLGFFADTSTSLFVLLRNNGIAFSRDNGATWEIKALGKSSQPLSKAGSDAGLFRRGNIGAGSAGSNPTFGEYEKIVPINKGQAWALIADKQIWFSRSVEHNFQRVLIPTEARTFVTYDVVPYPQNEANRLLVSINNKLFETKDGGVTWSTDDKIGLRTPIGNIGQIVIDPSNTEIIYIMLVDTRTTRRDGLYQRISGGSLFN